jgi:hypothetical protein
MATRVNDPYIFQLQRIRLGDRIGFVFPEEADRTAGIDLFQLASTSPFLAIRSGEPRLLRDRYLLPVSIDGRFGMAEAFLEFPLLVCPTRLGIVRFGVTVPHVPIDERALSIRDVRSDPMRLYTPLGTTLRRRLADSSADDVQPRRYIGQYSDVLGARGVRANELLQPLWLLDVSLMDQLYRELRLVFVGITPRTAEEDFSGSIR